MRRKDKTFLAVTNFQNFLLLEEKKRIW